MTIDVDGINKLQKEIAVASQAQDAISEWHTDLKRQMGGNKEELVRHIEKLCTEYMKTAPATLSHGRKFDNAKRTGFDTTAELRWCIYSGIALEVPDEMVEASTVSMDMLLGIEIEWEGLQGSLVKVGEGERAQYILFLSGKSYESEVQWVHGQTDLQWHTDEPYYVEPKNVALREAVKDRMDPRDVLLRNLEEQVRSKLGNILNPHLIGEETVEQAIDRVLKLVEDVKISGTAKSTSFPTGKLPLVVTVINPTDNPLIYCGVPVPLDNTDVVSSKYNAVHWCATHGVIVSSVG